MADSGSRAGQQLGNYRLTRLLGQGGFADVYLGEHIHIETLAAVKVLHTQIVGEDITGFKNEARTLAKLEHPNIVRVLDFGVDGTVPYLVMSYAPNGSLRERHRRGQKLPLDTIVSYVRQIADALQYAHDEKYIHRDIKPENMLLGKRNEILLSDFGIALVTQSSKMQSIQEMVGTVAYMAPEMLQGKPGRASDQYALGIVVYEWLCGDRPFHGGFTELASQHMFVPPPPLREKNPTLSPEIEQVAMTTLNKDPQARFGSVTAFANVLEQACKAEMDKLIPTKIKPRASIPLPPTALSSPQPKPLPSYFTTKTKSITEPIIKNTGTKGIKLSEPRSSDIMNKEDKLQISRYQQHIYSILLLLLSLVLFVSLTFFRSVFLLGGIAGFFTTIFGWSAYLLALGLIALAIAHFIEGKYNKHFIYGSFVIGIVLLCLVVVGESRLLLGGKTGGVLATLLVFPLQGWPPAVGHILLFGLFCVIAVVTFCITFDHILIVSRAIKRLVEDMLTHYFKSL